MPIGTMPNTCTCLREARRAKGFQNFGQAGIATNHSPEVIGRHERGEVALQMEDAIQYAEVYESPAILMAYCGECAIRHELFGKEDHHYEALPVTAIRVSNRLRNAERHADLLADIMDDGEVDSSEVGDLQTTLDFLKDIESVWRDLVTACMVNGLVGIKKDRPAGTGTVGGLSSARAQDKSRLL